MHPLAYVTWLGALAATAATPTGQWPAAIGLGFVCLLMYLGFHERYLGIWVGGWALLLLSQEATNTSLLGHGSAGNLALANVCFILAITLFSVSFLMYADLQRRLRWIFALCLLGVGAGVAQALGLASPFAASLGFQVICRGIALLTAAQLLLFARGRRELAPWTCALALLLLHVNARTGAGGVEAAFDFASAATLRLSILFVVLDESRARARRLAVLNAITSVAGAQDYRGTMVTAINELRNLYGAKFAWFRLAESDGPALMAQAGLPEWLSAKDLHVPLGSNVSTLPGAKYQTSHVSVESLSPELREDLERVGMRELVMVPVVGETTFIGVLVFGLTGRRSFTAEQFRFLSTTARQLGVAGEALHMFEQVLHSKRQWLNTIDSIADFILVHDDEPRVLRLNKALAQRLGHAVAELTGKPLASVLPNAQQGCPYCELAKRTAGEVSDPCFGGYSLISTSAYAEDQGGKAGTVHIVCDRTERRAEEERYHLLFESVQEGVFVSSPEGRLIDCNPAFVSLFGYKDRADALSMDIGKDLFLSEETRAAYLEEMAERGNLRNYEVALRRKDGRTVTLMENSFATRDSQGSITSYQGFLMDVTDKKRIEEEMRMRNRELGALNAMASLATRTFDVDEILQSTLRWTSELYKQHCDILLFDLESGRVMRSVTSRENRNHEREGLRRLVEEDLAEYLVQRQIELMTENDIADLPAQTQAWIAQHGVQSFVAVMMYSQRKIVGMLLVSSKNKNQFTETDRSLALAIARQLGNSVEKVLLYEDTARAYDNLRNTQEQLLQSEKMSAIGQLISGVAHELNNPLTAILGYAQLLETEPIGERGLDYVRKLYLQTQRTHRVVQNLLSFSRQRKPIQSKVDLRRVMEDALSLREFDLKLNNIVVERCYDPAAPFITGDAHQLEQVFLNIINNAVDAIMDFAQGGRLGVRIYAEGDRACVEFQDSGPGLTEPQKIFDPFYTTKKIGKGTGLGLSICYGIVKEHGGDILALNPKDGGALFRLKLPIAGPRKTASS